MTVVRRPVIVVTDIELSVVKAQRVAAVLTIPDSGRMVHVRTIDSADSISSIVEPIAPVDPDVSRNCPVARQPSRNSRRVAYAVISNNMIAVSWTTIDSRSKASRIWMGSGRSIGWWPLNDMTSTTTAAVISNAPAVASTVATAVSRSTDRWCMHSSSTLTTAAGMRPATSSTTLASAYSLATATSATSLSASRFASAATLNRAAGIRRAEAKVAQKTERQSQSESNHQFP